jgi:NAD+ kinase
MPHMVDVVLISNHRKPEVMAAVESFRPWLEQRANVIYEPNCEDRVAPSVDRADLVIVLGGDGTLLSQARQLVDLEAPIVGVNFGKLGFLAEFSLEELKSDWDRIIGGQCPLSERVMLDAGVYENADAEAPLFQSLAMNDCVITAGRPFRMIELAMAINPTRTTNTTKFGGDGVIVATPSGSTAYNASAGGPIIAPDVDAMVITPICPQSLAFRAIVVNGDDRVAITLQEANEGTTLVIDGQISHRMHAGNQLRINKYARRIKLVRNPTMGYWKRLANKMQWAAGPRRS